MLILEFVYMYWLAAFTQVRLQNFVVTGKFAVYAVFITNVCSVCFFITKICSVCIFLLQMFVGCAFFIFETTKSL